MAAPASDVRRSGRHDIPLGILGYTDKGIALARLARSALSHAGRRQWTRFLSQGGREHHVVRPAADKAALA